MFKGDDWHIFSFKNVRFTLSFFLDAIKARSFVIIVLLRVSIVILGLMTLISLQGHRYVRNTNCKLYVFDICPLYLKCWIISTYFFFKCTVWLVWLCYVIKRDNWYFSVGQVSGLGVNCNIGIYSDIINLINIKLCMMLLLIEFYLFIPLSVTLIRFQGHS